MRRLLLGALLTCAMAAPLQAQTAAPDVTQWQAVRAMADIEKQVSFGARAMETPGHLQTVTMIEEELRRRLNEQFHRQQQAITATPAAQIVSHLAVSTRDRLPCLGDAAIPLAIAASGGGHVAAVGSLDCLQCAAVVG